MGVGPAGLDPLSADPHDDGFGQGPAHRPDDGSAPGEAYPRAARPDGLDHALAAVLDAADRDGGDHRNAGDEHDGRADAGRQEADGREEANPDESRFSGGWARAGDGRAGDGINLTNDAQPHNDPSRDANARRPGDEPCRDAPGRGDPAPPLGPPGDDEDQALAHLRAAITVRPAPADVAGGDTAVSPLDVGHPEFQSIVRRSVLEAIRDHADANPDIEVCGILVGTVYEAPQASFVHLEAMIRGESSAGRSTQVTFTAETWQHVHRVMEERHAGKRILGWYHTHPGFGIFLSEMDLFIQRHFFNAPWQVAFVYDPRSRDAGMFAWRAAQVRRVDFVLDDESGPAAVAGTPAGGATATPARAAVPPSSPPAGGHADDPAAPIHAATLADLADRVRVLEGRVRWLLIGFAILLVAAIIWPLVVQVVMPPPVPGRPATGGTDPSTPDGPSSPAGPARPKPDRNFPLIP